jgi:hypothetical protein
MWVERIKGRNLPTMIVLRETLTRPLATLSHPMGVQTLTRSATTLSHPMGEGEDFETGHGEQIRVVRRVPGEEFQSPANALGLQPPNQLLLFWRELFDLLLGKLCHLRTHGVEFQDQSFRKSTIRFVLVPRLILSTPQQLAVLVNS